MPYSVQLAELLCARLCHDLGGPIASLAGAVELATPDATYLAEIAAASTELGLRLRLLRAAFGSRGVQLDLARLTELAAGVPGGDRVALDLSGLPRDINFPPALGRMLVNLLLLAPEAMPRGGTLALRQVDDAAILAQIAGRRAAWPNGFAGYVADPATAGAALAAPRLRLGPWLVLLGAQLGVRLSLLLPAGNGRGAGAAPLLLQATAPS